MRESGAITAADRRAAETLMGMRIERITGGSRKSPRKNRKSPRKNRKSPRRMRQ